jgi:hypothetical protein
MPRGLSRAKQETASTQKTVNNFSIAGKIRAKGLLIMKYGIELPDLEMMRLKALGRRFGENAKLHCAVNGHNYQKVNGIPGRICVCCGEPRK